MIGLHNKKNFLKYSFLVAAFTISMLVFPNKVFAGFGVSPGILGRENVKPGQSFEQEIVMSRSNPDEDYEVLIETELDEMEGWITFDPGLKVDFPKGEKLLKVIARFSIPEAAAYKDYSGIIRFKASPKASAEGVSIVEGVRVDANISITEVDSPELRVRLLDIEDVVLGDKVKLLIRAENSGNVDIAPTRATLSIMDLQQNVIESLETTDIEIIPAFQTNDIYAEFPTELALGEYFADAKVYFGEDLLREERLVFRIIEKVIVPESTTEDESTTFITCDNYLIFIISIVAVIATCVVVISKKVKESKKKRVILITLLVTLLIVIGMGFFKHIKCRGMISEVSEDTKEESIEGAATERGVAIFDTVVGLDEAEPRETTIKDGVLYYEVYESPDFDSKVIYYAVENEQLDFLEEKAKWYRVILEDGTVGWLPKISVKSVDTE